MAATDSAEIREAQASTSTTKILVVDDSLTIRMQVKELLEDNGLQVLLAENGEMCLEVLEKETPDVILLDVIMPEMDGIEVCRRIKSDEALKEIPILILTTVSDVENKAKGLNAGADDYVIKPFEVVELIARVNSILRAKEIFKQLKQTQLQLLQSEKMASVGQLAAGVAHEINNPNGFVRSNLGSLNKYINKVQELFKRYEEGLTSLQNNGSKEVLSFCEEIEEVKKKLKIDFIMKDIQKIITDSLTGTERIRKIVADLKDFSHVDQSKSNHANINEGIESTLNMVWNDIKDRCMVEKDYGDLPQLYCNQGQLNQVFMNLLLNAAQAIEEKGVITIATRYLNGSAADNTREQGYIEIKFKDTGIGIPEDVLNKVFEPFFTTRDVGKGTGLGLSVAYDIIKKHKGDISVESEVGKGTSLTIKLPLAEDKDAEIKV